jgi:hypothetical protein
LRRLESLHQTSLRHCRSGFFFTKMRRQTLFVRDQNLHSTAKIDPEQAFLIGLGTEGTVGEAGARSARARSRVKEKGR